MDKEKFFAAMKDGSFGQRLIDASALTTGNIIEIGGGEGYNTIRFATVASIRGAKVIVVDPFEKPKGGPDSYFDPYPYEKFKENIYGFQNIEVIKLPSQDPEAIQKMAEFMPVGFVFVDGIQYKANVVTDLQTAAMLKAEVICVDDYSRLTGISEVPLAVGEFLKSTEEYTFTHFGRREGYFIRK